MITNTSISNSILGQEKVVLLLGDLSDQLGADNMAKYLRNDAVKNLLREAEQDDDMKESALWARKAIFGQ